MAFERQLGMEAASYNNFRANTPVYSGKGVCMSVRVCLSVLACMGVRFTLLDNICV